MKIRWKWVAAVVLVTLWCALPFYLRFVLEWSPALVWPVWMFGSLLLGSTGGDGGDADPCLGA